jgi:hypothetical protein
MLNEFSHNLDMALWEHPLRLIFLYVSILTLTSLGFCYRYREARRKYRDDNVTSVQLNAQHVIIFVLFCVYLALIPAWQDFTLFDAHHLFKTIDGTKDWPHPPIWPAQGRLFPLSDQEFRYLAQISPTIFFYHFAFAIEVIAVAMITSRMVDNRYVGIAIAGAISTPAFAQAYFGLVFPERNLVFLLALFALGFDRWSQRGCLWCLAAAMVSGITLLFYKELGIILTGVVALLFLIKNKLITPVQRDARNTSAAIFLLISVAGWIAIYLLAIYPQIEAVYQTLRVVTRFDALANLIVQPWVYILIGMAFRRSKTVSEKWHLLDPLWDGFLIGAMIYTAALVVMRFDLNYYYAPPAFLAWLLFGRLLPKLSLNTKGMWVVYFFIAIQSYQAVCVIKPYKELVAAKSDAARFIGYLKSSTKNVTVHYPQASDYEAGLFSGFLNSKYSLNVKTIVRTEGNQAGSAKCINSINMPICHHGESLESGALSVSFGWPANMPDSSLIHISEPIGFWSNDYRVYVYEH